MPDTPPPNISDATMSTGVVLASRFFHRSLHLLLVALALLFLVPPVRQVSDEVLFVGVLSLALCWAVIDVVVYDDPAPYL
jgi:hypothetical protein